MASPKERGYILNPLTEFGSTSNSTTTIINGTSHGDGWSGKIVTTTTSTIVQSHPVPDWTLPLTIVAVLVIAIVVIAVARRKKA